MNFKTHLAFGILCGLLAFPFVKGIPWSLYFCIVAIGALLPDIDHPDSKLGKKLGFISKMANALGGHRGITHSIFLLAGLPLAIGYFFGTAYGIALFIGYASHLIMDSLNPKGVNYLHPITTLRMHGFIQTGSAGEWVVFFLILAGIGMKLLQVF